MIFFQDFIKCKQLPTELFIIYPPTEGEGVKLRVQFYCVFDVNKIKGWGGGGGRGRWAMLHVKLSMLKEMSKFTTESQKLLQGDVGEQFLRHVTKSHYYYL